MKTGQKKLTANEIVDLGVFAADIVVDVAATRVIVKILENAAPSAPTKAMAILYKIGGYGISLGIGYGIAGALDEVGQNIKKGIAMIKAAKEAKSEIPSGDEDGSRDTETELE